jgi:Bifunctional DNA primase/polymerase, N-terminal/Primase C terminal 1 (PriCT-1)
MQQLASEGIFTKWQPRYAEKHIATFPVGKDKKPAIKNWNKIGLKGSEQLAAKFPDHDALGFPLGPRSAVTIVDVDIKDPALLDDAQARYGRSPFIVETGGGYHAYYRYGVERRHIRPWGPEVPIDVLGGGYAVAAPSVGAKGPYEIIRGTLADLESLPPLRVMLDELRGPISTGKRNSTLFRYGLEQATYADDYETLLDIMRTRNMDCQQPLPDSEVIAATKSVWKYHQECRNLVGRGRAVIISHKLVDRLVTENQDAFILLTMLKRHHWGRDFILSKAMAAIFGWTVPRWYRARDFLVRCGIIACIHEGGMGPHDPPVYAWADSLQWGVNV